MECANSYLHTKLWPRESTCTQRGPRINHCHVEMQGEIELEKVWWHIGMEWPQKKTPKRTRCIEMQMELWKEASGTTGGAACEHVITTDDGAPTLGQTWGRED